MSSDEQHERLQADIEAGGEIASAVLTAAVRKRSRHDAHSDLRRATARLSATQARIGLAFLAYMHCARTRGGLRYVPGPDAAIAALIVAADTGFVAVRAAAAELLEPDAKAALANLAWAYREQRTAAITGAARLN